MSTTKKKGRQWRPFSRNKKEGKLMSSLANDPATLKSWTKEQAIQTIIQAKIPTAIEEIVSYWNTSVKLYDFLVNEAMEAYFKEHTDRQFPNIEGIKFANRTSAVTVNGVTYGPTQYNADGTVTTKSYSIGKLSNESVANEDGQTISSISYNISTGEVASETKYTYDSNGHVSKQETTSNGTTTVITNEYEEKDGLVVSSKAMANGAEVSHTEYEYDADGNKTKEKTYSGDTLTQELEYITIEK